MGKAKLILNVKIAKAKQCLQSDIVCIGNDGSQLLQQILWDKLHFCCAAYFTPYRTCSPIPFWFFQESDSTGH
jgi:hypothetical protein